MLAILLVTLFTAFASVYAFFRWQYSYWTRLNVPHTAPAFPFGNGIGDTRAMAGKLNQMYHEYKHSGSPFFGTFLLFRPIAVFTDLSVIKQILIKDFQHFIDRDMYVNEKLDPLTAHMFNAKSDKWRALRTKLTPTFTSGRMKFMYPTIIQVAKQFEVCLSKLVEQPQEVDIKELLARFTTDVIGTCAFGIECNSLEDPEAEFRIMGRSMFSAPRHSNLVLAIITAFPNAARALGIKRFRDDLSAFFMNVVRDTVAHREQNGIKRNDFMDLLIGMKADGALTIEEMAAQTFVFFVAGFETSSTAMMYALFELSVNQDIQQEVRDEINRVLSKHGGEFTYEAMMDMRIVDRVINESLRKYPPLPFLMRVSNKDYVVPETNVTLPAGSTIWIPSYSIQNDAEHYPNPEKFMPDRFTAENSANRENVSFLPFGEGPRNCVGARFGMMQSRVSLVTLLRHYKFTLGDRTPNPVVFGGDSPIILTTKDMYLKLTKV